MDLQLLWFVLIAVLWAGYFTLEGFDFGVGMLLPLVGRDDRDRATMLRAIGPVWDGNEVWLVVAGGATFAAFPAWYGTMFSAFYVALLLVLFFLIIRVVSFEWRAKSEDPRWRSFWTWCNTVGSVGAPLIWGIGLSALLYGVPLDSDGNFTGDLADLFNAYTVFAGVTVVCLFAFHGATFLRLRTVGELCTRAQHAAQRLALPAALVTSGLFAWTVAVAVDNNDKDAFPPILPAALGIAAVCLAVFFLMRRRTVLAFAMTAGGTIAVIATLFTSLYPSVMVSNPSSGNSLTVDGAASSHYSLEVMSIVALICVPLVLLYQGWTYHVFRHRVGDEPIRGDAAEEPIPPPQIEGEQRVSTNGSPKTLIVYYSLTKQTGRVVDAMASALEARGCHVTKALIEFLDQRYLPKLSEFPMKRPMLQIPVILPAQLRHKTGEIRIPPEAEAGDYDLVILASPTWWFQTSMPIRSYLESPAAKTVLNGKPFACASISRRYFSINLGQQKKLGEKNGGRWIDKTHFVVAGGQVKSMLSWLGYMKHGEPQERVMLLKMPPPNLQPDFEEQARSVVDGVADKALGPVAVPTS